MDLPEAIMTVLNNHWGSENAITRESLREDVWSVIWRAWSSHATGAQPSAVSDRQVRAEIGKLRESHPRGALICSHSGTSGYYLGDEAELRESVDQKIKTAVTSIRRARRQLKRGMAALEKVVQERMDL